MSFVLFVPGGVFVCVRPPSIRGRAE